MTEGIITYRLEVPEELWTKFKKKVPKTMTMNEAVLKLIKKEVGD